MNTIAKQATGVFQSTPSRRGRHQRIPPRGQTRGFQSTPSRRGRRADEVHNFLSYSFNPLPHAEGDHYCIVGNTGCGVSINSLTQRETLSPAAKCYECVFQSTPSRRGRPSYVAIIYLIRSFNPLPHAEGDTISNWKAGRYTPFQSTPSRRGRQPH